MLPVDVCCSFSYLEPFVAEKVIIRIFMLSILKINIIMLR